MLFSEEQRPTPPINASLGSTLAMSGTAEHVLCLLSHHSDTRREVTKKPPTKPGYCLTPGFSQPPLCNTGQSAPSRLFKDRGLSPSLHAIVQRLNAAFSHNGLHEKTD